MKAGAAKVAMLAALATALCGCTSATTTHPTAVTTPVNHTYAYYVDGTASGADVTYSTGSGTSQANIDLPLKNKTGFDGIQMTSADAPNLLYISAQNSGEDGEVRCRIVVDSVVVAENTASGGYKIATCKYSR